MAISKTSGSFTIQDEDTGEKAVVELDGSSKNALRVIAETSTAGGSAGTPGCPVFSPNYRASGSRTDIELLLTGTTIFSNTGNGKLEHFLIHLQAKETEIELIVDGVTLFRLDCEIWEDAGINNPYAGSFPIMYEKDRKVFHFNPNCPIEYTTSFEIKGYSDEEDARGYVVSYTDES